MNEKSAIRIFSIVIFISAVMILTATVLFIVHERKAYYLKVDGMDKSAASVTAAPAAVESKIPEKKEEEKLETAPFPAAHAALYNVVQEEVPDIYQSIANDIECSSLFKTLDNRLSKCITENALTVHVKAQHQQQYGTVVKVEKYGKDGKNFATDKTILLLNENIPDGESADLTIYPTAMITQDNDQTLEIFALNQLAAYKACMEGIDRQLDGAYYILDLHLQAKRNEELAQQSQQLAEQALQEAENARLQAQKEAEKSNVIINNNYYEDDNDRRYYRTISIPAWPLRPVRPQKPSQPSKPSHPSQPSKPSSGSSKPASSPTSHSMFAPGKINVL